MINVKLAEISIQLDNRYPDLEQLCREYVTEEPAQMSLRVTDEEIEAERRSQTYDFSNGYLETVCLYRKIALGILEHDVFRKIFEVSELINMDEVTRSKVIEKMTTERDLRNQMEYALQEAIAEGLAAGLAEAARKMVASGMTHEAVADILQIPEGRLKEML